MLKKDDRDKQMVYYQAGIGTYTSPQVASPLMSKISKVSVPSFGSFLFCSDPVEQTVDEAIAWNLDAHVMVLFSLFTLWLTSLTSITCY
jgi:Uncharacterized alpha/beta hydrolase domain (DUF2235)